MLNETVEITLENNEFPKVYPDDEAIQFLTDYGFHYKVDKKGFIVVFSGNTYIPKAPFRANLFNFLERFQELRFKKGERVYFRIHRQGLGVLIDYIFV